MELLVSKRIMPGLITRLHFEGMAHLVLVLDVLEGGSIVRFNLVHPFTEMATVSEPIFDLQLSSGVIGQLVFQSRLEGTTYFYNLTQNGLGVVDAATLEGLLRLDDFEEPGASVLFKYGAPIGSRFDQRNSFVHLEVELLNRIKFDFETGRELIKNSNLLKIETFLESGLDEKSWTGFGVFLVERLKGRYEIADSDIEELIRDWLFGVNSGEWSDPTSSWKYLNELLATLASRDDLVEFESLLERLR